MPKLEGGDLYGDDVNIAARIEALADAGSHVTHRWSKGDSNSWSHPERQRSEGATWVPPLLPVSESRPPEKRERSAELSAHGIGSGDAFVHVGVPNAHTPIALSSIVRIASIVTGSFRLSSIRRRSAAPELPAGAAAAAVRSRPRVLSPTMPPRPTSARRIPHR
jgi:hypothetical protein